MSGDQGELGAAVALQQQPHGHTEKDPRVKRDQHWRQNSEAGAVGRNRLIHRAVTLTVFLGICAAQVAWVVFLVRLGEQLLP